MPYRASMLKVSFCVCVWGGAWLCMHTCATVLKVWDHHWNELNVLKYIYRYCNHKNYEIQFLVNLIHVFFKIVLYTLMACA